MPKKRLLGIFALVIAASIWIFQPIPSCFSNVLGVCLVPNPIVAVTFGINPNWIAATLAAAFGVFFLVMTKHRGRK